MGERNSGKKRLSLVVGSHGGGGGACELLFLSLLLL